MASVKRCRSSYVTRRCLFVLVTVLLLRSTTVGGVAGVNDWLINKITSKVELEENGNLLILKNGLVSRTFTILPSFGTVDFRSNSKDMSILRTVHSEGFITLDGYEYPIGGLHVNGSHSYFNRTNTLSSLVSTSFEYVGHSSDFPKAPYNWVPGLRHSPSDVDWPPKGLTLTVHLKLMKQVKMSSHLNIIVSVHYEMYVGVPMLAKWITVQNTGNTPISVDGIVIEYLGTQKPYGSLHFSLSWLYVEASIPYGASVSWEVDPSANISPGADEPLLNCSYTIGPGVILQSPSSGERKSQICLEQFDTYRVLELITDTFDPERVALSRHRMTRLLAPQTQENPIFFHGTNATSSGFKLSIDQMSKVGFEMYIYSFGSGFNLEDLSDDNIGNVTADIGYAKSNSIEVGGYDLIDLERGHGGYGGNVGDDLDVVSPSTGELTVDACFASGWYDEVRDIILKFIDKTGLAMLETDGPYGGAVCASQNHNYHISASDSVYWQTRLQGELYSDLKAMDIFINQPDEYFYSGGNKAAMGYNENQFSLGRWEDLSISRQSMYDDTFHYIPTQGWMFVPLVQYHGGGAAAEFEPLSDHLLEYEWALAQYLGYGVAACYRGPRLYDSQETMLLVKKWVDFYKKYRDILISDIVHVKRPDMQDYDCILHVNPFITNRGLAMVFNPTQDTLVRDISLPLYYTGITTVALVLQEGQRPGVTYVLERDYSIQMPVTLLPQSITWFLVLSAN